jgi:hypothetical protein
VEHAKLSRMDFYVHALHDPREFRDSTFAITEAGVLTTTDGASVTVWSPHAWTRLEYVKEAEAAPVVEAE